jgi:transaldolase
MYLEEAKFSLWCDFVEKRFLQGEFLNLIDGGKVNGATSNPAIFKSAFLTSPAYKEAKGALVGKSPKEIYEALAVDDIIQAADVLRPLYDKGDDGFISIEVDPFLSDDAQGTIEEARRLVKAINRPNIMIKVPATKAGFEAMRILMGEGIHVNATLVFSPKQASGCIEAFREGSFTCKGTKPQGVISIFVSRFDRKLDPILKEKALPTSRVGIMNAAAIYRQIEDANLPNVRSLFASTGVKGDGLHPAYYVQELLFARSINTAPLETIHAFLQTGANSAIKCPDKEAIMQFFDTISQAGINMETVYTELIDEGVVAFHDAFKAILDAF